MWSSLKNSSDAALLFARAALGLLLLCFHAWPRLQTAMALWSHHAAHHSVWSSILLTIVAVAETLGSILLILGLWTRPAALLFGILVGQQVFNQIQGRGGFERAESVIELFLLLVVLFFVGPGRFSVDKT